MPAAASLPTPKLSRPCPFGAQLLLGDPVESLTKFAAERKAAAIVTDFSPLRVGRSWRDQLGAAVSVPV